MVVVTLYCWLLRLYPGSYRVEFGEEMVSVFREAQRDLPPNPTVKIRFYGREVFGLLSEALSAHVDGLFGPTILFRRFYMQPQFRFPRSTVFLMLLIFAGVLRAISRASIVAGDAVGSVWPSLVSILAFMLFTMCAAAAVVWGILHILRRSGVHRLENIHN